jgi:hypothetical protein
MEPTDSKWMQPRNGEMIGGGFFVFQRGGTTGRLKVGRAAKSPPLEHPTRESAEAEMKRLANKEVGKEFCVFEQVARCKKEILVPTSTADLDALDHARNFGAKA